MYVCDYINNMRLFQIHYYILVVIADLGRFKRRYDLIYIQLTV
jgi:hypothetical protein